MIYLVLFDCEGTLVNSSAGFGETALFPGCRDVLQSLHEHNLLLGIATTRPRGSLDNVVAEHALQNFFVTYQTGDIHPSKPNPSMITQAMYETGADASHSLMIGDSVSDIQMAKNAGVKSIGVCWGGADESVLRAAGADEIVHQYSQLPSVVLRLLNI